MLFLLSPAKALDFAAPSDQTPHTEPLFVPKAAELIALLRRKMPQEIATLMHLSDSLAALNVARYASWRRKFTAANAKQAVLAFDGDVYTGLDAKTLKPQELAWAQEHVLILSGLYGVLRPLDWMQPYRLEMGTALANAQGSNLYAFWRKPITHYLNQRLKADKKPIVVNLASQEYFKSVDRPSLRAQVIECVFEDEQNGAYKVVGFFAKRARGLMTRYAITEQITTVQGLTAFQAQGYAFAPAVSSPERLVFRRDTSTA
jgi:cytoplasmic iron level regulating protein YaaA (DUF328/UPF0246 family)